ncbi:MAG TPA: PDZ domain-containing protein [Planctomycetota bacterium]|nr:PDZ domain-containing protein [Planctomycetota bacterium]
MALLPAAALLAGCITSAPAGGVPDPLPEALAWQAAVARGAFLGLEGEENGSGSLDRLEFLPGVRVRRVVENSPAAAAGLRPGDVVLALDGRELNDPGALEALVAARGAGAGVELSVQRDDTVFAVPVTLAGAAAGPASGAPARPLYRLDVSRSRAGWATGQDGVVLVSAAPGSPALEAGLSIGDRVTAVDGAPVASDRELIRMLEARPPGAEVELSVAGATGLRPVELELAEEPTRITSVKLPVLFDYESSIDGGRTSTSVLDLWIVQLFEYRRENGERTWVLLELFGWEVFRFSSGVGELSS